METAREREIPLEGARSVIITLAPVVALHLGTTCSASCTCAMYQYSKCCILSLQLHVSPVILSSITGYDALYIQGTCSLYLGMGSSTLQYFAKYLNKVQVF